MRQEAADNKIYRLGRNEIECIHNPIFDPVRWVGYPAGDADALIQLLRKCYEEKCRGHRLVADRTWDRWAASHHQLFFRLMRERGISAPQPAPGFRFGMMGELEIPPKLDVASLEETLDQAAAELYYGRYAQARRVLEKVVAEFPFAEPLIGTIPSG